MDTSANTFGFTLIEVMIAATIMMFVGLLAFGALRSSSDAVASGSAQGYAQANVRDVMAAIVSEVEVAAKDEDEAINLDGIEVLDNGESVQPGTPGDEVRFQVPADNTGNNWSPRISYRFENEDENGNALLDGNEDDNADGLLTRRVVRVQDRNNDGDTDDAGEVRAVGGANDISNLEFRLNDEGDTLTITVASTRPVARTARRDGDEIEANLASATLTSRVYIMN